MEFKKLPQLVDVRNDLARHKTKKYVDNGLTSKREIGIHHSLTTSGDAFAFARYHVNTKGWPGIGYAFVIKKDGTIQWCWDLGVKTYHVGNSNRFVIGICLVGDFRIEEPTEAQEKSLRELHAALKVDMGSNYSRTRGHNEYPGYEWKDCPEFDYKEVLGIKTGKPFLDYPILKLGDENKYVGILQDRLNKKNCGPLVKDNDFGDKTEKAVAKFQKMMGLVVDRVVGPKTWESVLRD